MQVPRVIPCLLLTDEGLVKTLKFRNPRYIGDPINAVKIFNEKEVDELILLDIDATTNSRGPLFEVIEAIAAECFMPLAYGGGITSVDEAQEVLRRGAEKVCLNTVTVENPSLVSDLASSFGSQSVLVSIDVRKKLLGGYEVFVKGGRHKTGIDPLTHAVKMEELGAGEIMINSIDRDGTESGYDLELIRLISSQVNVPVVACGGAGSMHDFSRAIHDGGASAVAAGSLFVYHGPRRAVLISYPSQREIREL